MPDINKYIPWYRLAEPILGRLVPGGRTDKEIKDMISPNDWLIIPTLGESTRHQSIVRHEPNIYFSVDRNIDIGLVCNTLDSIFKMKNILLGYHSEERDQFIAHLGKLDSSFETSVGKKRYPNHPKQSPVYNTVFRAKSNKMDDQSFKRIFSLAESIYEEGREEQGRRGIKWNPIRPTVSLAECSLAHDESLFAEKLRAIVPLYELCLSIRTDAQIRKERKRNGIIERLRCPNCNYGPIPAQITRFCPECETKLVPV